MPEFSSSNERHVGMSSQYLTGCMNKNDIKEMLDDIAAYSGHVLKFGRVKKDAHGSISGSISTSLHKFGFRVLGFVKHDKVWTIHLEDPESSLEHGGLGFRPYVVPRFRNHPGLGAKVHSANFIIETLTSSQKLHAVPMYRTILREHYKVVSMPQGLSRKERVGYCVETIKKAHLPIKTYEQN